MSNDRNPTNSTLIQGLLEAERTGSYNTKILEDAIAELKNHPQSLKSADSAVANKPYNDDKVTFIKSPVWNACNRELTLSPTAYKMLNILRMTMSQQNTVTVDREIYCRILGIKRRQLASLISELRKGYFLAVAKPQAGHHPPEYMVNPRIGYRGKKDPGELVYRFWQLCGFAEKDIHIADVMFTHTAYPDLTTGNDHPHKDVGSGYIRVAAKKEPSGNPSPKSSHVTTKSTTKPTAGFRPMQDAELNKLFLEE